MCTRVASRTRKRGKPVTESNLHAEQVPQAEALSESDRNLGVQGGGSRTSSGGRAWRIRLSRSGWLVTITIAVTTVLWIAGRFGSLGSPELWPWRGPSQFVMLWSSALACLSILSVVRARALEPLFGGLDAAVHLHRKLGLAALLMLVVHVVLLAADAVAQGESVAAVLVPFWSRDGRSIDILTAYLLICLGALAYDRRLRHERWLALHRLIGVLFLLGTLHAAMEPGTIQQFEALRTWIVLLLLVGITAWIYPVLFFQRFGPRYRYQVECVVPHGSSTIDLVLRPLEKRMMYEPGTFVFVGVPSFKGKERELHPFSISSSPVERNLRVSIHQVGDFTRQLSYLSLGEDNPDFWKARKPGRFHSISSLKRADVDVYGPFGGFTLHRFAQFRRIVCIGAGIGITPFLGMLAFERSNQDFRRIWLYYVVRSDEDAVYDSEINASLSQAQSRIDYVRWLSTRRGRITAAAVDSELKPYTDYAVMLCGQPAFVSDLAQQFRSLGIPGDRIITEDLQFR